MFEVRFKSSPGADGWAVIEAVHFLSFSNLVI